ncbi:MAG: trehalase family glycosidase, partial [Acidimicrobiia bacterium]
RRERDLEAVAATRFAETGEAVGSSRFEAGPAAFNAIAAHGMDALSDLTGDDGWRDRAASLADAMDGILWDAQEGLWSDLAIIGGGDSVAVPTLDGVFGALATRDQSKAERALAQLDDETRFGAPFGLAYVARSHPTYRGDLYWRGAAWPQLNHLARVAAHRWGADELAEQIAGMSRRGAIKSGFSELWDPLTGEARGAVPQTWAALAAVPSEMVR